LWRAPSRLNDDECLRAIPADGIDLKEHLSDIERELILRALNDADWVVSHAAKQLRMGRTTLAEKMCKFGLQRDDLAPGV
tara:strand:+ start:246 stop:485 length:240 start_codon:yes stop_codon:yes gene_type:complete